MLHRDDLYDAVRSRDPATRVRDLIKSEFPVISPRTDLFHEGYRLLQENEFRTLPVCDERARGLAQHGGYSIGKPSETATDAEQCALGSGEGSVGWCLSWSANEAITGGAKRGSGSRPAAQTR